MTIQTEKKVSPIELLSEAQLEEFREAFNTFDEDGGGTIDKDELRKLLNFAGQTPSEDELRDMIMTIDADGTGDINFPEFVTLMAHKMATETSEETIRGAFNVFDTDGSGGISASEFLRVLEQLGETDITIDDIRDVVSGKYGRSLGDANRNGLVSYEEFEKVIHEEKRGGVEGNAAFRRAERVEGQQGMVGFGARLGSTPRGIARPASSSLK